MGDDTQPSIVMQLFEGIVRGYPDVTRRVMFGCPCAFSNGYLFALVDNGQLVLRLNEANRTALLARPDASLFAPGGTPMREYVVVPQGLLNVPQEIGVWIDKAWDYVQAMPPKVAKVKKPGPRR